MWEWGDLSTTYKHSEELAEKNKSERDGPINETSLQVKQSIGVVGSGLEKPCLLM